MNFYLPQHTRIITIMFCLDSSNSFLSDSSASKSYSFSFLICIMFRIMILKYNFNISPYLKNKLCRNMFYFVKKKFWEGILNYHYNFLSLIYIFIYYIHIRYMWIPCKHWLKLNKSSSLTRRKINNINKYTQYQTFC